MGEEAASLLVGGEQEKVRRGGTENYPAIASASAHGNQRYRFDRMFINLAAYVIISSSR